MRKSHSKGEYKDAFFERQTEINRGKIHIFLYHTLGISKISSNFASTKFVYMQQHSGFENRFIDVNFYHSDIVEDVSHYAPVFKLIDSTSFVVFPGIKAFPFSTEYSEMSALSLSSITLSIALIVVVLLFIILKKALKSSVWSLFLVGLFPKSMQETERRQIERNTLFINAINTLSFFSMALIIYTIFIRFDFFFSTKNFLNISEEIFSLAIMFIIIAIVFCFFYIRNGIIILLGEIFSFQKALKDYKKSFKLLFLSMFPVLLLIAVVMAFVPHVLMVFFSYFILIMGVCYLFFIVFSLIKFANFTNLFSIHIFLYLCTLEILPFVLVVKFLQNVSF